MPSRGQNGSVTFVGMSGQRITLRGTDGMAAQISLACDVNVSILKPDGSVLAPATCMEGSGVIEPRTLPATGTYTIVDPTMWAIGDVTLTLYDVPADTTSVTAIGEPAVSVPLSSPGQNGTLSFSGSAGQQVTVRLTSNTFGWVTVRLLKPDGTQLTSLYAPWSSFNLATQILPTSGTYTIVIDPGGASMGSISVAVTGP